MTVTECAAGQLVRPGRRAQPSSIGSASGCRKRQIRRTVGDLRGKDVADFGCGYDATDHAPLPRRGRAAPRWSTWPGAGPGRGPPGDRDRGRAARRAWPSCRSASLDVILCMSVIEHLWEPDVTLARVPPRAAPRRRVRDQRAVVARQAGPGVLRLQARAVAGRGDGRPQDATTTRRTCGRCSSRPVSGRATSPASGTSSV